MAVPSIDKLKVPVDAVENRFNNAAKQVNILKNIEDASEAFQVQLVVNTSQLSSEANKVVNGLLSLTQDLDDIVDVVSGSRATQLTHNFHNPASLGVAQLTKDVPGMKNQLVRDVSSSSSDLQLITGSSKNSSNGFLNVTITSPLPEAIAAATIKIGQELQVPNLNSVTKSITSGLVEATEDLLLNLDEHFDTALDITSAIDKAVNNVFNVTGSLLSVRNQLFNNIVGTASVINQKINVGLNSLIENVVEDVSGNIKRTVDVLVSENGIKISPADLDITQINRLISQGKYDEATDIIFKHSDYTRADIKSNLQNLKTGLADNKPTSSSVGVENVVRQMTSGKRSWEGAATKVQTPSTSNVASKGGAHTFSYITTLEELEVELKCVDREITELIVHWTETNNDQEFGAEEIQRAAALRNKAIPYHYLIKRDGALQRGLPADLESPALINNHQKYSLSVAFVGGINLPSSVVSDDISNNYKSKDSFTIAQWQTLDLLLSSAYSAWPGLQVIGHNDIDASAIDPGFDVIDYVDTKFNKKSLFTSPLTQGPMSRSQLIKQRVINNESYPV